MAKRINPNWIQKMDDKVAEWQQAEGDKPVIQVDESYLPAIQWLVMRLAALNIPARVIPLGARVMRVTTDTEQCHKCHGTGRC